MNFFQYTSFFNEKFSFYFLKTSYKLIKQTIMNEKKITDKEKIDAILENFHLNLAEFSRILGVKIDDIYSVYYEKVKGLSPLLMRKIVKQYPAISPYWLLTGEGDMTISDNINGNSNVIQHHNGMALPSVSNQWSNRAIKEIGDLCGIDEPVLITTHSGRNRSEATMPKWTLLSTHCARRTFVVTALQLGIPIEVITRWTGHSDLKAMKPYIAIVDELKARNMAKFNEV